MDLPHDHGQRIEREPEALPRAFQQAAEIFKLLSDATRLKIFWILCHYEECVINLSALMAMSSPAVSHHLHQLREAGLAVTRREGKEVYYRAADSEKAQFLHRTIEALMEIACPETDHCQTDARGV